MNKLIPVITVIALLTVTLFVINDSDDSEALTDGYWEFTVDEHGNATITKYTKTTAIPNQIVVPSTVSSGGDTYPVKTVGKYYAPGSSFQRVFPQIGGYSLTFSEGIERIETYACYNLGNYFNGTLTLPSTLTYIGDYAFNTCHFRGELIIPDSVTYIGEHAFQNCQGVITKFKLPSNITEINTYAFAGMSNTNCDLIIPEGVTRIEDYAFWSSTFGANINNPTCAVLPSSVTSIGTDAFNLSYALTTLYNLSSLPITVGSSAYGNIGLHVTTIYTTLPTAPSVTSSPTATTIQIGDSWQYTITYSGTEAVMSATYPNWMSLSGDVLSGSDAPGGSYPIEITVEDRFYRTATQTFNVIVTSDYVVSIESSNTAYGTVDQSILIVPYDTPYSVSGDKLTVGSTEITATPTVQDAQYTYSFSGWNVSSGTVTDHMSIVANFEQTVREYTVTINTNAYGTVNLNSIPVPYGTILEVGEGGVLYIGENVVTATPLPDTIDTHYYFRQWVLPTGMSSGDEITQNIVVSARFGDQVREYEITFNSYPNGYGSVVIESGTGYVAYGSTITVDGDHLEISGGPRRLSVKAVPSDMEVDWTYSFDNWTISSYTVTGDMTIIANFTRTANTVANVTLSTPYGHIHFNGDDYTTLTVRVPMPSMVYGMDNTLNLWEYEITIDEEFQTELLTYTFDRWAGIPLDNQVYNGLTLNAVFTQEGRYYEVNFSIADGFGTLTTDRVLVLYNTLIYSENNVVVVGANTITATPTENGEDVTYEFVRWDGIPMSGRILEDTDISAKVMRTVTADAFNIVEIEHGETERVWSVPDEYLPLMLVIPVMLLIGMVLLSLNRKSDDEDYDNY